MQLYFITIKTEIWWATDLFEPKNVKFQNEATFSYILSPDPTFPNLFLLSDQYNTSQLVGCLPPWDL